ncbi:MAG: CrcB family protein [Gemmatimonadaceae bacterium]|nr:CrcB family protein [Gemmatimonadaceae bacterium]
MRLAPLLAVAAGSAIGGAARYAVAIALASRSTTFPAGTLTVNVAGAFVLGLVVRSLAEPGAAGGATTMTWLFLTVGVCGGFTTYSAFALDTVRMLQGAQAPRAALYMALSVGLTVLAVYAGLMAGFMALRLAGRAS